MPLLYDPGIFMPTHEADFPATSWMITWPDGPWHLHDTEPGGTVYLVRAAGVQRIMWETRVIRSFAVPYESVDSLAAEVMRRWGLEIQTRNMSPNGFCIGWQAEPIARLDREPLPVAAPTAGDHNGIEVLADLDGLQFGDELTPAFRSRWQLPDGHNTLCSGRAPIGWFDRPGSCW